MKGDSLQIRNARPEELDIVSGLLKSAYIQYEKSFPPEAWHFYLEDIMDVRGRLTESELIVAELRGRLVGTVTLYLKPSPPYDGGWPPGWAGIRLLAVDPAYRGKGIGRALMDECIRRCRDNDIVTTGLHTTKIMDVALRMYERMGFVRTPEFDFHPAPGTVVLAYRLDLQ